MLGMLRHRIYLAVVTGHFAVDMLNSVGAVLLAVLATPLGLSNAQIGLALTIYLLLGSLSQPLFGWLSDKLAGRTMLLVGASVVWMAVLYAGVALAPTWGLLLPLFLLAALGSGLFHPIGTAVASSALPAQRGQATALFFFGGQIGLATGPILAGWLAGWFGAEGIIPLTLAALLPALLAFRLIGQDRRNAAADAQAQAALAAHTPVQASPRARLQRTALILIAAFIVLVALRSSVQQVFQAFLPKLFADRGWEPVLYGWLTGTFMGAAAFGNVFIGTLADRFGLRMATVVPLLIAVPTGLLALSESSLIANFIGCAIAGLFVGGLHTVMVVHAQHLLPVKQGLSAGLILGFTFASGTIGTWFVGVLADSYGLGLMMQAAVWLSLPAALLALTLPGRIAPQPTSNAAPAPAGD